MSQYKSYRVADKRAESSIITSFYLEPQDGPAPSFWPGEYLIFKIPGDKDGQPVRREYSISGVFNGKLRVTIKREPANNGYGPGVGSAYFHEVVQVGELVEAAGPFGQFRLDRDSPRHAVLLSGGVGLTPLMAMAHDLSAAKRSFTFVHACEDGAVHAMRDEITALASSASNIATHFCYRFPRHEDKPGRDYQSAGVLTAGTLQKLLPLADYDFYLCGPAPFMQSIYDILLNLGVRPDRIRYEFFGPATILKPRAGDDSLSPPDRDTVDGTDTPTVHFAKAGIAVPWDPASANLLEFAEDQGLMPDFSCRAGTCTSCLTKILSGETAYTVEPFEKPEKGYALICCAVPAGDVTLEL